MNYKEINRKSWNDRVDGHMKSEFYAVDEFIKGKSSLNSIELDLLGDIKGKSILHLQCHFGQDSISLARMGANVTAMDLSDKAIEKAKELAETCQVDCEFICSDVYDLPKNLDKKFDIVFTSYGTIGWLPDMNKWGSVVSHFLKPKGEFILVEFHPFVWMYDDDFTKVKYNYFNVEPISETETGSYADKESQKEMSYVMWNHPISDVMKGLVDNGLSLLEMQEFDYSPYPCFSGVEEVEKGKYVIKKMERKIPMVYALRLNKM